MRILDSQRYWAFFKAYLICFTALVGLNIVIDAFSNFDEFTQRASGADLFFVMGRYYLVHMSQFYDRLCGVISMMAAIFTVTWMQKNNELLAMLAAGISTHRVIRPVLISAVLVSGVSVYNQEVIMPRFAEELQRRHADDGNEKVGVHGGYDSNKVYIHGREADRGTMTIMGFNATIPVKISGSLRELEALQARYIPPDDPTAPLKGGWLLRRASLKENTAEEDEFTQDVLIPVQDLTGFPPPFGAAPDLGGAAYFLRTDLSFQAVTRRPEWYQFATTLDLIRGLDDPANESQRADIAVFLHSRILRPLLALTLMFMSLPLVLGGYGRNMFINLGLSLGTSALFYALCFVAQYLGGNGVISAELSGWAPLIGFGTFATARWGTIRT